MFGAILASFASLNECLHVYYQKISSFLVGELEHVEVMGHCRMRLMEHCAKPLVKVCGIMS